MSLANPLWGAPRIHGELLKLGIDVGQTSVAKYMARRRRPPSQGCRTFLRNHADGIAAMDLFVVPTISFRLLYGLLILRHDRRRIIWLGVTAYPTAEWIARQLVEACGWEQVPRYILRDRDDAYGEAFTRRVRAMGIRDRPTARRYRIDPTRVHRSYRRARGAAPSSRSSAERTWRWTRMRRLRVRCRPSATYSACRSWADCTITMFGSDFREGQPTLRPSINQSESFVTSKKSKLLTFC
jgi:hypothetical protein